MASSVRTRTAFVSAILMAAVVVSFVGPSIASTVSLLDDDATTAANRTHLPLNTAAVPDSISESAPESVEADLSFRLPGHVVTPSTRPCESDTSVRSGRSVSGTAPGGQAYLCVYRL